MKEEKYIEILKQLENPSRVEVMLIDGYDVIMSSKNTNDTIDWFRVNSRKLEDYLIKHNQRFFYVLEKDGDYDACIYLYIGQDLTRIDMERLIEDYQKRCPVGLKYFLENSHFNSIEKSKYERKKTTLEQILLQKSSDVIEVLEP